MLQINTEKVPLTPDEQGVLRVGNSRVTLGTLVEFFEQGASAEEIARNFTTLELSDVYSVIGFYLRHLEEVKAHLAREEEAAEALRDGIEAEFSNKPLRDRLRRIKHQGQQLSGT